MSDETPEQVRNRLVEISDELRRVPATEFATRHRLHTAADDLRRQLGELGNDDITLDRRADRAARKSSHTIDEDLEAAKAANVSPTEGGGSS